MEHLWREQKIRRLIWEKRHEMDKQGIVAPVNVLIAGPSCSGKSMLAEYLAYAFPGKKGTVVPEDSYQKYLEEITKTEYGYLFDSPNAYYLDKYQAAALELSIENGYTYVPAFDKDTRRRLGFVLRTESGKINIFEGLHAISDLSLPNCIKFYLDTPLETCLERRIIRDGMHFNKDENLVREYWRECVIPMYEAHILPQKEKRGVIVIR